MISSLLTTISKALKTLAEFLTVLLLGLVAGVLIILPWLLRILALLGWLAGTFGRLEWDDQRCRDVVSRHDESQTGRPNKRTIN